jgi:hypothetical protein
MHAAWCERTFRPPNARRLAQLIAVTDVYTWKLLRRDRGLSRKQTDRRRGSLEALRDEDVEVVATLPAAAATGRGAPPNARVLPFVPHAPLLDKAACVRQAPGCGRSASTRSGCARRSARR